MNAKHKTGVALVLDFAERALRSGETAAGVAVSLGMLAGLAEIAPAELPRLARALGPDHREVRQLIAAIVAGLVSSEELGGVCRSLRVRTEEMEQALSEIRRAVPRMKFDGLN